MYFLFLFFFAAQPRPMITPEQEDFLYRILTIPFEERLWKALVTLGTLHAFYDGLKPSPEARRLDSFSRTRKFHPLSVLLLVVGIEP